MTDLVARTLAAAAARMRAGQRADLRARGVVATPAELARHAVARVDALLQREFGVGLADERVVIVDPAVGTGVWLAAVLEHTRAAGARSELIGFDSDAEALATVEALLGDEARAQGARWSLRNANTLELASGFPARDVVRVVLGNPPWAARSLSRGLALSDAWLAEFRRDHEGAPLGERRSGVLSDDYVRFVRWSLEQARTGTAGALVCLATNASYLDGPVHRGMRASLLRAFDHVELLDLGGNGLLSRGGEARDDNLFGVRVGAALLWALRRAAPRSERAPVVLYRELRGSAHDKLRALAEPVVSSAHVPTAPWFRFRPGSDGDEAGFSLDDAFLFHREGVQTNRDAIATAATRAELEQRMRDIIGGKLVLEGSRHFDAVLSRAQLAAAHERDADLIAELAYRPLETRFFLTLAPLCHRPRRELRAALSHAPLSLLTVRKERGRAAFNMFAVAEHVADACYLSTRSSCRTRVFPSHTPEGASNLAPALGAALEQRVGVPVSAAAVITYALAVLGSPRFRRERNDALRQDYARLPWPRDRAHFAEACRVGQSFVHALTGPAVEVSRELVALPAAAARFCEGAVVVEGARVFTVEPSALAVHIGHHPLAASVQRRQGASVADWVDALSRAAAWANAERAADHALFPA